MNDLKAGKRFGNFIPQTTDYNKIPYTVVLSRKPRPTFFVTKNIIYQFLSEIRITVILCVMTRSSSSDVDTTISIDLRSKLNPKALNKWLIFKKKKMR